MAKTLNQVFPPIVDSSIPAFISTQSNLTINFSLPRTVNFKSIKHVDVKITQQSNNKSVIDEEKYFDGIIYLNIDNIQDNQNDYSFSISSNDIKTGNSVGWIPDIYYKIQIRFGYGLLNYDNNKTSFFKWKKEQTSLQAFSEWSNVIITKSITDPTVKILNDTDISPVDIGVIIDSSENTETSISPVFQGGYISSSEEPLNKYKFSLYEGFSIEENQKPLLSSGWILYDGSQTDSCNALIKYKFNEILPIYDKEGNKQAYTVTFEILTLNNYYKISAPYTFRITIPSIGELDNVQIRVRDNSKQNLFSKDENEYWFNYQKADENGSLKIYLKNNPEIASSLDGTFYLIRSSEKSNFGVWEDLAKFVEYNNESFNKNFVLLYEDFTIESGIKYKYAIQRQNGAGLRTVPKYETLLDLEPTDIIQRIKNAPYHLSNFQHTYIYNNNIQLKLPFDVKLNSFKHTTLMQKQDTLNSKYPVVLRNGIAYYGEFSLSAKLSILGDDTETFIYRKDNLGKSTLDPNDQSLKGGYYYNEDLVIPADKYLDQYTRGEKSEKNFQYTRTDLSDNNIFVERIFREQAESFLNNGGYKLYKSPTEGNMIITLTNMSMTPKVELGRMIYDFSATGYEVADCTLDNMKKYKINPLNVVTNSMRTANYGLNNKIHVVPGQVRGAFLGKYVQEEYFNPSLNQSSVKIVDNKSFDEELDNIILSIKDQEEKIIDTNSNSYYKLNKVKQIWVELYPKINIQQEIINLRSQILDLRESDKEDILSEVEKEILIAKYEMILKQYEKSQSNPITLILNGKEISMFPGRVYQLDDVDIKTLYLKFTRPILINYVAEIEETEYASAITIASRNLIAWGQISGVFTNNNSIINNHLYTVSPDLIVSEDYQYGLYRTLYPTDVIMEKSHNKISVLYDQYDGKSYSDLKNEIKDQLEYNKTNYLLDKGKFISQSSQLLREFKPLASFNYKDGKRSDIWRINENQTLSYEFNTFEMIEIEADENTEFEYTPDTQEDQNWYKIKIGPTNKYILKPIPHRIGKIRFVKPTYAIINYKASALVQLNGALIVNAEEEEY